MGLPRNYGNGVISTDPETGDWLLAFGVAFPSFSDPKVYPPHGAVLWRVDFNAWYSWDALTRSWIIIEVASDVIELFNAVDAIRLRVDQPRPHVHRAEDVAGVAETIDRLMLRPPPPAPQRDTSVDQLLLRPTSPHTHGYRDLADAPDWILASQIFGA